MINVGVVGGTGYTGVELLRLLVSHSHVNITVITSRTEDSVPVTDVFPGLRGKTALSFTKPDIGVLSECDLVFFATPNGTAMRMVPELLEKGVRVIDLAADFRLIDPAEWEKWYGLSHSCEALLEEAVYGLPELNREKVKNARLIANPGCYPTAVTLGLLPLIGSQAIEINSPLIADCKSGVSGAGREAKIASLCAEVSDSFKAYGVSGHRHLPEITQILNSASSQPVNLTFVPHLVPMIRGIHATIYAGYIAQEIDLQSLYESHYQDELFVDVMPAHSHPETRMVKGSNHCRIAVHRQQGSESVIILSVIDNLVKGAAGQAIQNMNIMFDLDEHAGLMTTPLFP